MLGITLKPRPNSWDILYIRYIQAVLKLEIQLRYPRPSFVTSLKIGFSNRGYGHQPMLVIINLLHPAGFHSLYKKRLIQYVTVFMLKGIKFVVNLIHFDGCLSYLLQFERDYNLFNCKLMKKGFMLV